MSDRTRPDEARGIAYAAIAYVLWGAVPLYWRHFDGVAPFEVIVHRIVWCALFVMAITVARGRIPHVAAIFRNPRLLATLALTSVLITCNWSVYIYSVATRQLVEASLGYYITPLISIGLGVVLFGEHLSRLRLLAVCLAGVAVAVKAASLGHIPMIASVLALSFGFYGYFRKQAPVDALDGLLVETGILLPAAAGLLVFWYMIDNASFPSGSIGRDSLLMASGPVTAIPLALFAAGARRIRLSTLGFLQYLAPSLTLLLAVFGFGERFTRLDAVSFGCVWGALVLVALDGRLSRFSARAPTIGV
ncbi:MAG TPA: EamA family transporter RarD [Rhizomicrobium sp.]|nr:EamA family transporter RarD [Rhizomicrobium sp.]